LYSAARTYVDVSRARSTPTELMVGPAETAPDAVQPWAAAERESTM
jgi:hypothetical protein